MANECALGMQRGIKVNDCYICSPVKVMRLFFVAAAFFCPLLLINIVSDQRNGKESVIMRFFLCNAKCRMPNLERLLKDFRGEQKKKSWKDEEGRRKFLDDC